MLRFTQGNLLLAATEAIVNTVNTVGVMGKGIALAFKEAYPDNFEAYQAACKAGEVQIGRMFVTENRALHGSKWIINFPTKKHWRQPSKLEWIREGLADLARVIKERGIRSVAIPPLGCGNGGLDWQDVRPLIEHTFADLPQVEAVVYEPTQAYYTAPKQASDKKLTPARALIAEAIRRYSVLGIECSYLEVQKLAYLLERTLKRLGTSDPLRMHFDADKYGPYSDRLRHLLDALDGVYLQSDKRLADAGPMDRIHFKDERREEVEQYLHTPEAQEFLPALDQLARLIDGFESPLGMELLATVDWLLVRNHIEHSVGGVREALEAWPAGADAAQRKRRLFDDRLIGLALDRVAA